MRRLWIGSVCTWSLLSCVPFLLIRAWADEPTAAPQNQLPAIACAFETRVLTSSPHPSPAPRVWYLWRQPEWIEVQDTTKDEGEIWERGANGQIAFQRVFHRDQRVINYTPGDLRALQSSPDWQRLSSILHPTFLKQTLQATGETTVLERQAQRYQGQVNGVTFEVLWFDTEQIPALIRQIYPDCEEIVHLTAIPPLPSASWPRRATSDYRHLDYADLGDMASDPFVRRLLRGMQHSHAH